MIDWISKSNRKQKDRDAHERELRKSLAEKISTLEAIESEEPNDHTEIVLNGRRLRVAKEQITIYDLADGASKLPD